MSASCCATPPEVIAGSTRMGAGTAQKIALNMLSTLTAIHLGHVHDGYMVNLNADNMKLQRPRRAHRRGDRRQRRARRRAVLDKAGGSVKAAILLAAGAGDAQCGARTSRKAPARSCGRRLLEHVESQREQAASLGLTTQTEPEQVNREN